MIQFYNSRTMEHQGLLSTIQLVYWILELELAMSQGILKYWLQMIKVGGIICLFKATMMLELLDQGLLFYPQSSFNMVANMTLRILPLSYKI